MTMTYALFNLIHMFSRQLSLRKWKFQVLFFCPRRFALRQLSELPIFAIRIDDCQLRGNGALLGRITFHEPFSPRATVPFPLCQPNSPPPSPVFKLEHIALVIFGPLFSFVGRHAGDLTAGGNFGIRTSGGDWAGNNSVQALHDSATTWLEPTENVEDC